MMNLKIKHEQPTKYISHTLRDTAHIHDRFHSYILTEY
jgi:hypothetical protein